MPYKVIVADVKTDLDPNSYWLTFNLSPSKHFNIVEILNKPEFHELKYMEIYGTYSRYCVREDKLVIEIDIEFRRFRGNQDTELLKQLASYCLSLCKPDYVKTSYVNANDPTQIISILR